MLFVGPGLVSPTLLYDVRSRQVGAVSVTRVSSLFGLDLDALAGVAPASAGLSNFVGLAGFGVSGSWSLPLSGWYLTAGVGGAWRAGQVLSGGPFASVGVRF